MIKIGILATYKNSNNIYDDYYKIISIYVKKLKQLNAIPIMIFDNEELSLCDGFIIPGGNKIDAMCYEIINYCIVNNKPLLGICMGMQAMCLYDFLYGKVGKYDSLLFKEEYNKAKRNNLILLKELDDIHGGLLSSCNIEASNETITNSTHDIIIEKESKLFKIYNKENINVISMHRYGYNRNLNIFKKSAFKNDVIEAIEYKKENSFIIGVQYHAELEENNILFKEFINKVRSFIE